MLNNLEYTFFDQKFADQFIQECTQMGFETTLKKDESPTGEALFDITIVSGLTDAQTEQIEDLYSDILFGGQAAEIEGTEGEGVVSDACGVQVQLASGDFTTIAVHPEIMNKILSVLTIDELQKFLAQVAEDIENPKIGPICKRKDLPSL